VEGDFSRVNGRFGGISDVIEAFLRAKRFHAMACSCRTMADQSGFASSAVIPCA
jgi:hypothetical protein